MPIFVCGINHKTAPLEVREQLIFPLEKLPIYLTDLHNNENITDAVIISTCNRSEIYCEAQQEAQVVEWFCRQHSLPKNQIQNYLYVYKNQHAIEHMMQVACGLDSLILGEPQILGQMKQAFSESCAAGTVGSLFNKLFQEIFAVAKEVRTNTAIGACPVSVASTAVSLAKQFVPDFASANIILVGAGDTIDLVLRYLHSSNITIVNRNEKHAIELAKKYSVHAAGLSKLPQLLEKADVLISATGSSKPIITQEMFTHVRYRNLLHIIDIAVPRDVDPAVNTLPGIKLFCIDDLKTTIQQHLQGREHAADKAREVIKRRSKNFIEWLSAFDVVATTIKAYRRQVEDISHAELAKAARQLQRGDDPLQVITAFAHAFTNKLLHTPSVQLRQAGVDGRMEMLQLAQELFAITQPESELI